jgi:hypothetical protein
MGFRENLKSELTYSGILLMQKASDTKTVGRKLVLYPLITIN